MQTPWTHPETVVVLAMRGKEGYRFLRGDIHQVVRKEAILILSADRVNPYTKSGLRRWQIAAAFPSPEAAQDAETLITKALGAEISILGITGLVGTHDDIIEAVGEVDSLLTRIFQDRKVVRYSSAKESPAVYRLA